MAWLIYIAENIETGAEYVGVTKQRLNDRRLKHFSEADRNVSRCRIFGSAIRKYGREAFRWSVYAEDIQDQDAAVAIECELIAQRKPAYNILPGGSGYYGGHQKTREHVEKIAAKLRGKKRTPEQLERFRTVRADPSYRANQALKSSRPVRCMDDGHGFSSAKRAAEFYGGVGAGMILLCAHRKAASAGGRVFRFSSELY